MRVESAAILSIEENNGIYSMWLEGGGIKVRAGQFVNVYLPSESMLLPRPISVCELDGNRLRLVFQVLGQGTRLMSGLSAGERLKILGGLGNGFEVKPAREHILVGGGIGIPPLIELAKRLCMENQQVRAYLGGRTAGFLEYLAEDFRKANATVAFATDDGSLGHHGNVVELMRAQGVSGQIYACGPRPMLRAVAAYDGTAQVSMEERMACGIGVCVGCVVRIKSDGGFAYKKVCKDGPVFRGNEVAWDE